MNFIDSPLLVCGCYYSKALLTYLACSTLPLSRFTLPYLTLFALPYPCATLFCLALHYLPYPWPCMSCLTIVKGAVIGVVPFPNELIKHEKVVLVSKSSVCATTLKHQTFALPFFPPIFFPFLPPTLSSSSSHPFAITPPWSPSKLPFFFFDSHKTHLRLPHPLQILHWDSPRVVDRP